MATQSKLAVILHADVVGSTALVHLDERIAHARIQNAFRRFSEIIVTHEGIAHELRGDALVAEFSCASDAVLGAAEFQIANDNYNGDLEGAVRPVLRVGIALGEVIVADETITGAGVVLAQRLEQLAAPGAICISAAVREALPERLAFDFQDLGEHELKGFAAPQRVCQVNRIEEFVETRGNVIEREVASRVGFRINLHPDTADRQLPSGKNHRVANCEA